MRALITGVSGQDGSHMADYLHTLGYEVWGLVQSRRQDVQNAVKDKFPFLQVVAGDITDKDSLAQAILKAEPHEVYNFAAFTHAGDSFKQPSYTMMANGIGAENVFRAVLQYAPDAMVYQASTSELFGETFRRVREPLNETHPFSPISPYGVAKHYAHMAADIYRRQGLWVACGIAFNHQSERGDPIFVNRKITLGLARCKLGLQKHLRLGNLAASRDWGYAPEYVRAFHLILQQPKPRDYVVATGVAISITRWLDLVAANYGISWSDYVVIDDEFLRPTDIDVLKGDASLIKQELGWEARVGIEELARILCEHDLKVVEAEGCRLSLTKT